jgi:hypothetical protein
MTKKDLQYCSPYADLNDNNLFIVQIKRLVDYKQGQFQHNCVCLMSGLISERLHQIRQCNDAKRSPMIINDIQSMHLSLSQDIKHISQRTVRCNDDRLRNFFRLALQKLYDTIINTRKGAL